MPDDLLTILERLVGPIDRTAITDAPVYDFDPFDPHADVDPFGHHANAEADRMERAWDRGAASREGVL